MQIKNLTTYLETIAPSSYQESYDNAGLIVGDKQAEIKGVLVCLDSTEAVVDEAIELGCNLIIAHHPIVFKGLKRFNGSNYVERVVMKAIKHDIALYAIHTNLDNVYQQGVNTKIAEMLGLQNTRILAPKANLKQITANISNDATADAIARLEAMGIEQIELTELPTHAKINIVYASAQASAVKRIINTSDYVEVNVLNKNAKVGSGMIGFLPEAMDSMAFLAFLKKTMKVGAVKYTDILKDKVQKIALCGGSGGFLLRNAIGAGADIFITADYKYHEFFDADGKIVIADIGHFESEQFTIDLLFDIISQKFSNFALHSTKVVTNPVNYL